MDHKHYYNSTFFTHPNAYIEVIGYEKMLKEARIRNKVLFDKLQIPSS